jgi:hypothetical protein
VDPLTCSLALLVAASLGGNSEARALPVTVQDDAVMLHGSGAEVQSAARRMAGLGVDRVRITAGWSALAPEPRSRTMPEFNPVNSDEYPRQPWARLDRAVKAVTNAGLDPQLDIAFFAPRWATRHRHQPNTRNRYRWGPNVEQFGLFAEAAARRYNGRHRDPARPTRRLPAVRLWTSWNEPNHESFLLPQWRREKGKWVPRSPHLYREMHNRAYASIKGINPANQVLLGGTAPFGEAGRGPRHSIAPLHFLRELACIDRRGRPLDRPACADFEPLQADGYSHHPYSFYDRPDAPSLHSDDVTFGDLKRLSRTLDRLHSLGRTTSRLNIFVTEFGYETNPPDAIRGVSLEEQAQYHGLATYIAWKQTDVTMFAQFLLNDIGPPPDAKNPIDRSYNFQTGLFFYDGRAKPAAAAFKLPFWAEAQSIAGNDVVVLFGQVRPSTGRKRMEIEMQAPDGSWIPVRTYETRPAGDLTCGDTTSFLTDTQGFYLRLAPYQGPTSYRARWIKADGESEYGVPIPVGPPETPTAQ